MCVAIVVAFEILVENIGNARACSTSDAIALKSITQKFIFL